MKTIGLNVTIELMAKDEFRIDFLEPESGSSKSIICHHAADSQQITEEDKEIINEIRSWADLMRDEEAEE